MGSSGSAAANMQSPLAETLCGACLQAYTQVLRAVVEGALEHHVRYWLGSLGGGLGTKLAWESAGDERMKERTAGHVARRAPARERDATRMTGSQREREDAQFSGREETATMELLR